MVSQKDFHNTELKPGTTKPVSDSSVFSNPFRAKEDRKKAILERHVDMTDKQVGWSSLSTVVPAFIALYTGNQIWIYVINLPGFSALPGFKAPFHGNGQSALNPGTTVFETAERKL